MRGLALVRPAGDASRRLRVGGRSPLAMIEAALEAVRPPLDVWVDDAGADRDAALRRALGRAPAAPYLVVWDAEWPLAGAGCVERLVAALERRPVAVCAAPVKATIKRGDHDVIAGGVPRERLISIAGPRAYRREAAERVAARGTADGLDPGLPLAPVLDELAATPVRDAADAALATALLGLR